MKPSVFEDFELALFETVVGLGLDPSAKCAKVRVTFIDDDDTTAEIELIRDGYGHRFPEGGAQ